MESKRWRDGKRERDAEWYDANVMNTAETPGKRMNGEREREKKKAEQNRCTLRKEKRMKG